MRSKRWLERRGEYPIKDEQFKNQKVVSLSGEELQRAISDIV
jgi:hypothetical protein